MFRFAFVIALGLTMTTTAQAETLFRGLLHFTKVSGPECNDAGRVGDRYNTQFHPRIAGNANFAAITRLYDFGGISYKLEGASFTPTLQKTITGGLGWDAYTPQKPISVAVLTQVPANLTENSPTVTLTGKIKNPWGDPGSETCVVDFTAVYVRRLD